MVTDDRVRVDGSLAGCETFGMSKIPVRREEITPEWLAVQLSGIGECEIARLDHEALTGHNPNLSQVFRTRIEYTVRTPEHPDVVIVKLPPVDDAVRLREAALGPYVGELGSYRLLESYYGGKQCVVTKSDHAEYHHLDDDDSNSTFVNLIPLASTFNCPILRDARTRQRKSLVVTLPAELDPNNLLRRAHLHFAQWDIALAYA